MSMEDLGWGLQMMLVGMGTVFLLLFLLTGLLMAMGLLDRPKPPPAVEPAPEPQQLPPSSADADAQPAVTIAADGLDDDTIAAIAVAVITHAEVRRRSAAPETRSFAPGSQLFASRWVAIGRGIQNMPWRRN